MKPTSKPFPPSGLTLNVRFWRKPTENGAASDWRNACKNWPNKAARFFPLRQRRRRSLTLRSELGNVKLAVDYGQDPLTARWGCPLLGAWELMPHQKFTPGYAEKLCFTVTATGSYEEAAQVASQWDQSIDDSTLHALVQRIGGRTKTGAAAVCESAAGASAPAGSQSVGRADGRRLPSAIPGRRMGPKKTKEDRVEWHELKLGVFYRHEASARTEGGRGLLTDKLVVSWQGQAMELGRRLNWEALREGLGRARQTLFLGDGAEWVWNLRRIGGLARWNCWTSTMAANTCGIWAAPCTAKRNRRSPSGYTPYDTNCETVGKDTSCARSLNSRNDEAKRGK